MRAKKSGQIIARLAFLTPDAIRFMQRREAVGASRS
jgi:hypothetical protein